MSDFSRVMELALAADAAKVAEMMGTTQQTSAAATSQHTIAQAEARQQAAADTKRK